LKGIFIGWSAGGGVAQQLAANFPSLVQGIVLLASVTPLGAKLYKKPKEEGGESYIPTR
jgi:pimeloyl-ACP methyl ester carboxylesterase